MTDGYVVLRVSDVEALMEEWGDLDQDPFWRPQSVSYRCRNQGMALPSAPCGFHHEGECVVEVRRPVPEPATKPDAECLDCRGFKSAYPHLTDEPCAACGGEGVTAVWRGKAIGTCLSCGGSGVATTEGATDG